MPADFAGFARELRALLWCRFFLVGEEALPLGGYSGVLPLRRLREDGPEFGGSVLDLDFGHGEVGVGRVGAAMGGRKECRAETVRCSRRG